MRDDYRPGVPAFVRCGRKPLGQGPGLEPQRIWHPTLGHEWLVCAVLEADEDAAPPLKCRWRCRVNGPLPGQPNHRGQFEMEIWAYASHRRPGWWIAPARPQAVPGNSGSETPRDAELR